MAPDSAPGYRCFSAVRSVLCLLLVVSIAWIWFEFRASRHPSGSLACEHSCIEILRSHDDATRIAGPKTVEETFRNVSVPDGDGIVIYVITGFAAIRGSNMAGVQSDSFS